MIKYVRLYFSIMLRIVLPTTSFLFLHLLPFSSPVIPQSLVVDSTLFTHSQPYNGPLTLPFLLLCFKYPPSPLSSPTIHHHINFEVKKCHENVQ